MSFEVTRPGFRAAAGLAAVLFLLPAGPALAQHPDDKQGLLKGDAAMHGQDAAIHAQTRSYIHALAWTAGFNGGWPAHPANRDTLLPAEHKHWAASLEWYFRAHASLATFTARCADDLQKWGRGAMRYTNERHLKYNKFPLDFALAFEAMQQIEPRLDRAFARRAWDDAAAQPARCSIAALRHWGRMSAVTVDHLVLMREQAIHRAAMRDFMPASLSQAQERMQQAVQGEACQQSADAVTPQEKAEKFACEPRTLELTTGAAREGGRWQLDQKITGIRFEGCVMRMEMGAVTFESGAAGAPPPSRELDWRKVASLRLDAGDNGDQRRITLSGPIRKPSEVFHLLVTTGDATRLLGAAEKLRTSCGG